MDRRYTVLMNSAKRDRGWGYPLASFMIVFALQMLLQFFVSLPLQLGILGNGKSFGPLAWTGALLAATGIVIETLADWQLVRFKAEPRNKGAVLDKGLWRYSRHPNHFGDACVWWGLYLLASETSLGLWAVPGPLLLTFLLLRVSGAPTIEGHLAETRPQYAEYLRRTSAFVPWPRKRD
jgi:steroid 5-alpha reductase family enzyme